MRRATGIRLLSVLALLLGFMLVGIERAAAGAAPTLTTHAMDCFSGVGSAIFEECHDNFDSSTIVGDVGADTGLIVITDFQGALGAYVYCRDLTDNEVLYDGSYADSGGGVVFPVEEDDEIVCDVYLIYPASSGSGSSTSDSGSSSTSSEVSTTTTLPSTGAGISSANQTLLLMALVSLLGLVAFGTAAFGVSTRRSR
jgi:hypothetical protein